MAATIKVDKSWTGEQKRRLQQWLNRYGFTDAGGDNLDEDGVIGPKTNEALEKMNRYQQDMKTPSAETQQLQKQLNDWGYQDVSGNSLKEDGVYGPKTDAASNEFENGFIGGLTNGRIQQKTVQKKEFPKMPGNAGVDLQNYIIPKGGPKKVSVADEYNLVNYFKDPVIRNLPVANNNVLENIKKLVAQKQKNAIVSMFQDKATTFEPKTKEFIPWINRQPENNLLENILDKKTQNKKDALLDSIHDINTNRSNSIKNLSIDNPDQLKDNIKEQFDKVEGAIEKQVGMHLDDNGTKAERKDDFFFSTPDNFREFSGYGDFYDAFADDGLRFDLNTDKATFEYKGKKYRFQVWDGNYLLDSMMTGAESGLYVERSEESKNNAIKGIGDILNLQKITDPQVILNTGKNIFGVDYDVASKENQVEMEVELWDHTNDQQPILTVDSAKHCKDYNEGKTYWQFGSKYNKEVDKENLYIKGTLRSTDIDLLGAIAAAKSEKGEIVFDQVAGPDNNGNYILTYTFDSPKKALEKQAASGEGVLGGGFGGGGGSAW